VIDSNLLGSVACLEHAAACGAGFLFLSTSRVYPISALRALPLEVAGERVVLARGSAGPGWSEHGISADFSLAGARSLYGATKLCTELLIEEYAAMRGLRTIALRCGVIAGPWQQGRVDQGFVSLWAARHRYGGRLDYIGFGGDGRQVRDVLHVDDLCDLVSLLLRNSAHFAGRIYCAGGGPAHSVSLRELSALLADRCGRRIEIGSKPETHPADIPWFVTDNRAISAATGWAPRRGIPELLDDVLAWLDAERAQLEALFAG
jgi:CDP-paratose 2-epimerase